MSSVKTKIDTDLNKTCPTHPISPTELMQIKIPTKKGRKRVESWTYPTGLTKQEYMATAILQGLIISQHKLQYKDKRCLAEVAVDITEELIKSLNKRNTYGN